jgi:hypothetical protein
LAHHADAAIIAFSQRSVWEAYASVSGASRSTETFDAFSGIYQPQLTGSVGGIGWTATADGGLDVRAAGGTQALSTANPVELLFVFSGTPVHGVGANVFGTDAGRNVLPIVVRLMLSNGTSVVRTVGSATSFVGFWSTDSAITSVRILPEAGGESLAGAFANVDNLTFAAIPGPGTVVLLAAAGVTVRRRRR